MKDKLLKLLKIILPIAAWLIIWEIAAHLVNNSYFLPSATETALRLLELVIAPNFFKIIFSTIFRVVLGLVLGIILGIALAVLSHHFPLIESFISPIMSVIKSTPVASFIVILWVTIDGGALAVFISILMVMPIIWQNLMDGYNSISRELIEVSEVFEFSYMKKAKLLIFPALLKYFIPALITSTGLAWKSEIAAEIITYTKNSIGASISDGKYFLDTPLVFAWTLIVVVFSLLLEALTKLLLRRCNNGTKD